MTTHRSKLPLTIVLSIILNRKPDWPGLRFFSFPTEFIS